LSRLRISPFNVQLGQEDIAQLSDFPGSRHYVSNQRSTRVIAFDMNVFSVSLRGLHAQLPDWQ
jgi:hypothetical protein